MRLALTVLIVGAATMATVAAGAPAAAPVWGECTMPPQPGIERDPRQQCATLKVPLDYRAPRGRTIEITISRIATAQPGTRRGILLSNPGGPGDQGLDLPSALGTVLPQKVLDQYDLVGFDPRGIGHSTPVTCGIDPAPPRSQVLPYPAPDGGIQRNVSFARTTAAACAKHSGDLLRFITTANTARDMDRIRAVLGEPKLSYYGISYGTYLGAVYLSLFPGRGDRIVLDSAVDPGLVWRDMFRTWNEAFALRLPDFLTFAAERDAVYHLGATPDEVRRTYDRLTAALDERPLPNPGGPELDGNTLREITRSLLYLDIALPSLAEVWQALAEAVSTGSGVDSAAVARLSSAGHVTAGDRTGAADVPVDNNVAALYAVICNDAAWPRNVSLHARQVAADRRAWPMTAGMPSNIWPCAAWPTRPAEPPVTVTGNGARNVLILQNTRDPSTSLRSARGLRAALGRRAAMITVDQGGHGVFGLGSCADEATNTFLATGELQARDRFCSAGDTVRSAAAPYIPPGWPL
ncbi:alpha/beta hydrolase [Nonomuraea endophytica]|uniref:alpha/beta hydrolase n=1 Tax=Nonomuraea endophytica TaxID=714136 RepID=UPI0037CA3574